MRKISTMILLVAVPAFIASHYGCNTVRPEQETQARKEKLYDAQIAKLDKGFGLIPFYKEGSSAFLGKTALVTMEARRKKELEKEKEKFKAQAMERFKGVKNVYWVPPPDNPKLYLALELFPRDPFDYPDWTTAVKTGLIRPIDWIEGEKDDDDDKEFFNEDIIFKINDRMMANVRFPHDIHNYWLSCKVCHPGIFIAKKGANDFGMTDIWNGEYCGRCHGRVAFQPIGFENCIRCHSVRRQKVFF